MGRAKSVREAKIGFYFGFSFNNWRDVNILTEFVRAVCNSTGAIRMSDCFVK